MRASGSRCARTVLFSTSSSTACSLEIFEAVSSVRLSAGVGYVSRAGGSVGASVGASAVSYTHLNNLNAGRGTILVSGAEGSLWSGSVSLEFVIEKAVPKVTVIWDDSAEYTEGDDVPPIRLDLSLIHI